MASVSLSSGGIIETKGRLQGGETAALLFADFALTDKSHHVGGIREE